MMDAIDIFGFLARKAATARTAIVTVTAVAGSSMRNPGAHLAVASDGDWLGSLSGGCIEAAVVAEAMDALAEQRPREVRFGTGSLYIDIRLPCGGSIDVLITPIDDLMLGQRALDYFAARRPFVLQLPFDGCGGSLEPGQPDWRTQRSDLAFGVAHVPQLCVTIIGHGASVTALDALARTLGATTRVFTPDAAIVHQLGLTGTPTTLLRTPSDPITLSADRWTAIAFVFHDHDWETQLIGRALASPAFYVGAMGGRMANALRVEMLAAAGVAPHDIARLRAPIGLIPSSRDPQVLALSALSEIVRDFEAIEHRDAAAPTGVAGA
jgi:xanthine dehydrogenase accessory factor